MNPEGNQRFQNIKVTYLYFVPVLLFQKKSGKRVVWKLVWELSFCNISKTLPNAKSQQQLLPYTRRSLCEHTAGRSTSFSSPGLVIQVL